MTKKKLFKDNKYYKNETSEKTESDNYYSSSNEETESDNYYSSSNEKTESSNEETINTSSTSSNGSCSQNSSYSSESSETSYTSDSSDESSSDDRSFRVPSKHKKCGKIIPVSKQKKLLKKGDIFKELIKYQIKNIPTKWKLNVNDMKRICKYIESSIFDPDSCCIWKGYITNANNANKGTYVNFYFKNKKVALHRLLYSNFVAPLDSSEYLKFNCDNKGVCCNVNHYEKYKYSKKNGSMKKEKSEIEKKKESKEIIIIGADENDKLIIDFD